MHTQIGNATGLVRWLGTRMWVAGKATLRSGRRATFRAHNLSENEVISLIVSMRKTKAQHSYIALPSVAGKCSPIIDTQPRLKFLEF